ncbi:type II secretion system protein GspN [Desulfobacter latus]|uniref:Type II secretion system protein GspN n=1 Tax=Desulfobacter latus TaxID=2292 RepID=A0A850SWW7_9BACT|nr:type II secretion system protein GspN [Desulfobacter latus]NWH05639.1 type II secretion system protein GspN [Desulfobacter latus]
MMKLKIAGYILFFAGTLVFALYYRFPGDLAGEVINRELSRVDRRGSLDFQALSPALPFGAAAENIILNWQGSPVVALGDSRISLNLASLTRAEREVLFELHPFGGRVSGHAVVGSDDSKSLRLNAVFESLKPAGVNLGPDLSGCRLSGMLNGSAEARIDKGHMAELNGEFNWGRLALDFPEPLFGIRQFSFSKGQIAFQSQGENEIQIKNCNFKGPRMDVEVSGTLRPGRSIGKTGLHLNTAFVLYPLFFMDAGNASPRQVRRGQTDNVVLHLKIRGTLENPAITMDKGGG